MGSEMCIRDRLHTLTRLLSTGFTRSFNETRSLSTWSAHALNLLRNLCELISLANDTWLSTEGDLCATCYDHTTSRKPWERVRMTLFSVPPLVHRSLHPSRLAPFSTALISDFLLPSLPSMLCGVAAHRCKPIQPCQSPKANPSFAIEATYRRTVPFQSNHVRAEHPLPQPMDFGLTCLSKLHACLWWDSNPHTLGLSPEP